MALNINRDSGKGSTNENNLPLVPPVAPTPVLSTPGDAPVAGKIGALAQIVAAAQRGTAASNQFAIPTFGSPGVSQAALPSPIAPQQPGVPAGVPSSLAGLFGGAQPAAQPTGGLSDYGLEPAPEFQGMDALGAETGAMAMEPPAPMPGQPASQSSAPITGATTISDLVARGLGVNQAPQAPAMAQPGMAAPRVPQLPPMPQLPTPTGPQVLPQYAGADSRANFTPGGTPQLMPEAQARVDLANAPTFADWANQLQQMGIASNPAAGTFGTGARQPQLPPMPQLPTPSGIPSGLAAPQAAPQASPYGNPQIAQAGVQALPGPQAPGSGQGPAAPAQQVQAQAQPPVAPAPAAGPAPAPAVDPVVADLQRQVAELRARIPAAPAAPAAQAPATPQADPGRRYDPSQVPEQTPEEAPAEAPQEAPEEAPQEAPEYEPALKGSPLQNAEKVAPAIKGGQLNIGGPNLKNASKRVPIATLARIGLNEAILAQFVEHSQVGTLNWYKDTVKNDGEAASLLYEFFRNQAQENMVVLLLDKNDKPISVLRHAIGGVASVGFHPNILAGVAASTPGCRKVYIAHSHPSGTMKFSAADMTAASSVAKLIAGVGIEFKGQIVVGDQENAPIAGGRGENATGPRYIFHPGGQDVDVFMQTYKDTEGNSLPITLAVDQPMGNYSQADKNGAGAGVRLVERVFSIRGNSLFPKISNGADAVRAIVPLLARKPGIAFLDNANRLMGVLPVSIDEMLMLTSEQTGKRGALKIRKTNETISPMDDPSLDPAGPDVEVENSPLAKILAAQERSNAPRIMISIGDADITDKNTANAVENVETAAQMYRLDLLDVVSNTQNVRNRLKQASSKASSTPKLPTGDRLGIREEGEAYDPAPLENEDEQDARDEAALNAISGNQATRGDIGTKPADGIEGIVRGGLNPNEGVNETNPEDPNAGAEFARQEREAGARVNPPGITTPVTGLENATPAEPIIKKSRAPRKKPAAPNPSVFPTKLDSTLPFGRLTGDQMAQFGLSDAMLDQFVEHSTTGHVMSGVEFVKSAEDAAHVVAGLRKRPQEQVILLITDKNGRPIQIAEHMLSQPQACGFNPGILIGTAASTPGAAKVWFIHNHPSGKPSLSPADISAGGNIQKLTEAANLKFEGTMAIAGTRFAQLTPSGRIESNLAIKAAPRKFKVPITERMFAFRVSQNAKQINDPAIAMAEAERIFGQTQPGIMLLDNSNRLVATIPLAADVLQAMKAKIPGTDQTGFNRYVAGIDRSNPVNAMIYTADVDAGVARKIIQNISGMAGATKINVLDAFGVGGISRQSDIRTYGSDFQEEGSDYNPDEGQPQGEPKNLRDVVDQAAKKKNELEVGEGDPDADSMAEAIKAEPMPSAADMAKLTGRLVPNHDDGLLASQGFITKRASQDMARIMERINKRFPDGYPVDGWNDNGIYDQGKKKIANLRLRYESDADPIGNYEAQDYVFIDAVFEDGTTHMIASLDLMRGYAGTPEVTKIGMSHVNTDLQKLGLGSILYVEGGERLRRMGQRYITGSVINPAAVATRVKAFPAGSTELLAVPGSSSMSQKEMADAALKVIKGGTAAYTRTTLDPNVALESSQPYNQAGSYDIVFYDAAIKGFNSGRNGNPDKDRSGRAIVGKDGVTFTGYKHLKDVSLTLDEWNDLMDELKSDGEARISMPDGDIVITSAKKGSSRVREDGAQADQDDQLTEPAMPYDDGENTRIPGSERDERLKRLEEKAREVEQRGYMHVGHGWYSGSKDEKPAAWKKKAKLWTLSSDGRIVFSKTIDKLEVAYLNAKKRALADAEFKAKTATPGPDRNNYERSAYQLTKKIDELEGEMKSNSSPITHMRLTSGFSETEYPGRNPQGRVEITDDGVLVSIISFRGKMESVADERMVMQDLREAVAKDLGVSPDKVRVIDMDGGTVETDTPEDGSAREPAAEYGDKPQKLNMDRAFPTTGRDGENVSGVDLFSSQAKELIGKGYKVKLYNQNDVNPSFSLIDSDGKEIVSVSLSFRMKQTKDGLKLVESPAKKKQGFPHKGASVFIEAFIPRDRTLGREHDEAMVGVFHEILERSRQIGATRVYFDTLDHGRLTLGFQDDMSGEATRVDGNPFSAIQVAMGKTGPEDWRHFDENWSEAIFALDPNKAYEPGAAYDDGENQAIPGGGRQAWLKKQAELRAKNELPGAKRIQWWTDVGHKRGKAAREKTWLWAYDKQGKLQVINSEELRDKMMRDGYIGPAPTHLDWEESYFPGLLAGTAHGRIDATEDVVRVSLAGRIKDSAFREQVKQELAEYIGVEVDRVKGYDFTGDGMPEVFEPGADYGSSDPVLTQEREVANHADEDLAARGFITREATKMDLPGAKLEIYPMKVRSRTIPVSDEFKAANPHIDWEAVENDNKPDDIYKGHIIYKGKKIAVFDFSMQEDNDHMELEWIKVNPTYRGLGLSKVIIAEITERAKRTGLGEVYSLVVDPQNRPISALESVLGAENVEWSGGDFDETHGRDPFRQQDPDTGGWFVERKDVTAKIPNKYSADELKLLDDIKKGFDERKNLAKWKKIQAKKGAKLLNQTQAGSDAEMKQLAQDLKGMDLDEAKAYFKENPDKVLLMSQPGLPPHLEKIIKAMREIGYNDAKAYLEAHPLGKLLLANGRIVLVRDASEIPGLSPLEAAGGGFNALVLGNDREATYFVGDGISQEELDALIKHEVGVHMGIGKDTDMVNDLFAELRTLVETGEAGDMDRIMAHQAMSDAFAVVASHYGMRSDPSHRLQQGDRILNKISQGLLSSRSRYTDQRITEILKNEGLTDEQIDNFMRVWREETLGYLMNVMARREANVNAPKDGLLKIIIQYIKAAIIRMAYANSDGGNRVLAGATMGAIRGSSKVAGMLGMKQLSKLLAITPGDVRAIAQGYVQAYASGKEVGMPDTRTGTVESDSQEDAKDAQEARVRGRASDPVTSAATFFNKRENRASDRTLSGREAFAAEARANPQPDAPGSATQVEKGQMDWEEKPGAISEFAPMVNVSGSVALSEARNPTGDTRDSSLLVADEAGNKIEFPKVSSLAAAAGLPADVAALLDVPIYITQGRQGTGADGKFGRGAQADPEGQGSSGYGLEHVEWKHGWQLDALASEGKWRSGNAIDAIQKIMDSATHISVAINPDGSVFGVNVYSAQTTMTVVLRMSTGSDPVLHVQTAFPGSNVVKDNGKVNENNLKKPLKLDDFKKSMARNSPEGSTIVASGADAGQQTSQAEQTGEQQAAAEAKTLEKLSEVQGNGPAGPKLFNAIPPTPPPPAPTTPTSPAPAPLNPPATNDDMARRVGDVLRGRYFDGISTKAHQNAERTGSAAVRAIADIIHTRPGTESPSSERDLPKAIMSARIKYQNKFNQIMRPLRDQLGRMTSEQREQFYRELVDQITGRTNIQPGVAGHAATQLIDLLKELHDYRTAAGEDLGQVQQYFPAVYNSDLITANRTAFIADATRAYELELSQDPNLTPQEIQAKAAAAAAALYRTHTRGMGDAEWASIFNSGQNSSTENSSKERVFGRQAQGIMSKWQTPDPFYVISRYIGSAVKRAELVRRFGPEGQNWEAMSNAMEADGVPIETINEMSQLVRLAAGLGSTPLDNSERMFMDTVNLYTAAAAMGKSAMNNLFEPSAMGIRGSTVGNPFRTVNAYAETWSRFIRNLVQMLPVLGKHVGPTFWQEYGEHIGSIHNSLDDAWMSMHAMEHGMEEANPAMRWITNRVYQANLMEATENAKLQASHALGHAYILDHAGMLDGSHWISRLLKFDTRSTAEEAMLELGIPKSKQDAFAAWCATVKQTKDRGARMAMMTDGSEMARLYEEAQIRFSHQSAVRANRAHKPVFQDAVLGRLALQLMSFSYSYYSEVTDRMYRMASRAVTTKDMPAIQRISMMLPLMLSPLTVVAMGALFESKDYLFPTESSEKRKKDHWIFKLFNASSFAGMFGPKLEMATKYIARDQPPGGIAGQTVVGVGRVGKKAIELSMDDNKTPAQKEAALKQAAARAAVAPIKGAAVIAGSALHPAAGAAAVALTNDTGWSNELQNIETPKKGTDPKPEGLPKYRK